MSEDKDRYNATDWSEELKLRLMSEIQCAHQFFCDPSKGPVWQGGDPTGYIARKYCSAQLGDITKKYESGFQSGIVVADSGTASYGLYQFHSGSGTVTEFLNYLENSHRRDPQAREIVRRLKEKLPDVDNPSGEFARTWMEIARDKQLKGKFKRFQEEFALRKYYYPQVEWFKTYNIDLQSAPLAVKEAVLSTSIQHGVERARNAFFHPHLDKLKGENPDWGAFVDEVYKERGKRYSQFQKRYSEEHSEIRTMLATEPYCLPETEVARQEYPRIVTGALSSMLPYKHKYEEASRRNPALPHPEQVMNFDQMKRTAESHAWELYSSKVPNLDRNEVNVDHLQSWDDVEKFTAKDLPTMAYFAKRSQVSSELKDNFYVDYLKSNHFDNLGYPVTDFGRSYAQVTANMYTYANSGISGPGSDSHYRKEGTPITPRRGTREENTYNTYSDYGRGRWAPRVYAASLTGANTIRATRAILSADPATHLEATLNNIAYSARYFSAYNRGLTFGAVNSRGQNVVQTQGQQQVYSTGIQQTSSQTSYSSSSQLYQSQAQQSFHSQHSSSVPSTPGFDTGQTPGAHDDGNNIDPVTGHHRDIR